MPHLLITIVAIIMMSIMTLATINYLPADRPVVELTRDLVLEAERSTRRATERYGLDHGTLPSNKASLVPDYLFEPARPHGLEWFIGRNSYDGLNSGTWLCLTGSLSAAQAKGASLAILRLSPDVVAQGASCGLAPDQSTTIEQTSAAITIWLMLDSHLEQ
ncbi:hypothetical protein [Thioalkalivibrio thiocyanodenitrificans]|uniref:hypothetical protein n=1 Tax=Thioalkalivibrio thiocyanodenitrificans TaxID=243063 RepID=UPI000365BA9F|nr:hypothetical protein [Thioalkalivibrio thiocyanodenitrificans]